MRTLICAAAFAFAASASFANSEQNTAPDAPKLSDAVAYKCAEQTAVDKRFTDEEAHTPRHCVRIPRERARQTAMPLQVNYMVGVYR